MKKVNSSSVEALGYHEESQTLRVWFKQGRRYDYLGVTPSEFHKLVTADSIGAYINKYIKRLFDYREVT